MLLDIADLGYRRGHADQAFTVVLPRLTIRRGETLALTGASGSGKSTLLELLGLVAAPLPGAVFRWYGPDMEAVDLAALWRANAQRTLARLRAGSLGFVMQTGGLLPFLTVWENINVNRRLLGLAEEASPVWDIVKALELDGLLHRRPAELSIGQQQRASVARALAHRPALVLADEPSSALDPRLADRVLGLLRDLASGLGTAVVIATHERRYVEALGLREMRARPWDGPGGLGTRFEG
jgi:putative ABC transport system ATP-binding protein